jgi:cation diffusion facilitator family transporter
VSAGPHPPAVDRVLPAPSAADERYRDTQRVTLLGALVNLLLALGKIFFGVIGHSQALVADGVHSLSDLATDALVLFAARHASRDADEDHPYGHGRFETAATVGLGIFLAAVGLGILYDAVRRLFAPELLLQPGWLALAVAAISIVAKEALYHWTVRVAHRLRSPMLRANAWHHRSDAISSVVVLVGVGGTMAGLPYLDAIAAAGVALMILRIGWGLGWQSIRELVDTALDREQVAGIRRAILAVDGVNALHLLRTRRMGADALVDVHVLVDADLSVSEGHQIGEAVRRKLIAEFEEVSDVMVHIDPEDDEQAAPTTGLPPREEMLRRLHERWRGVAPAVAVENVRLHYLEGKVHVELFLPLTAVASVAEARRLADALKQAAQSLEEVGAVEVGYR